MPSATYVLFGATGDLATRKIMPALARLVTAGGAEGMRFIATSRRPWKSEEYRSFLRPYLAGIPTAEEFLLHIDYHQLSLSEAAGYASLRKKITTVHNFYHLAIEPQFYATAAARLGSAGLQGTLLIEKPFGHDAASAQALEQELEEHFTPEQILRIDHYLAKVGLQDIAAQVEDKVARVTCRLFEEIDIEGRGAFYDATGALRDVGQSHALAMLSSVLRAPGGTRAEALAELVPADPARAVFGQYEGYQVEPEVAANSTVETYFRIETASRDPRWRSVSLVLEAGKALGIRRTEIEIAYTDGSMFTQPLTAPTLGEYALLAQAARAGDTSLFVSFEEVMSAWEFLAPLLSNPPRPKRYPKGHMPQW